MKVPVVKVISDGTLQGTRVMFEGQELPGIKRIEIGAIDASHPQLIGAVITFAYVDFELDAEIRSIDVDEGVLRQGEQRK